MIMRMNDGLQKNADKIGKDELVVLSACNTCGIYIDSVSAITNTSKHRVWSPKRRLVRNIPETFYGGDERNYFAFGSGRRCLQVPCG